MSARLALFAVAVFAVPVSSFAAPPAWRVDKAASSLGFASSMAGERFTGVFRSWDADIRFDPAQLAASSVTATIDVGSVTTNNADRDQALPTPTFFNAPAFPRATFVAKGFTVTGPGRYQTVGVLTLRGVAKPLTLPFTLAVTGTQARMTSAVAINRLAFGVGQGEWKATDAIPSAVTVTIALTARRAP